MRALLTTVGSRGDVQPMLVLGAELARRGHEVCVAAPPNFRERAALDGLRFFSIGADTDELIEQNKSLAEQNPLASLPAQIALLRRETARQLGDVLSWSEPVDVVVAAGLSLGGRALAEKLAARYAYVAYSLSGLRSTEYPPAPLPIFGLPRWGNRALWAALVGLFDAALGGVIAEARASWRLPSAPAWRSIHGSLTLLAQDEVLGAVPGDAAGFAARVPALVRAPSAALPSPVERFLASRGGGPVLYVGFGSMPNLDREKLIAMLRSVVSATDAKVIFFSPDAAGADDERMLVVGELDHATLFARVDLLVHHGGAGTTATALRAGVPQFIVPHIQDQFFHGKRLHELALGPRPVPKAKLSAPALISAVESNARYRDRARAVAESLRGTNGAAAAADFLERLTAR